MGQVVALGAVKCKAQLALVSACGKGFVTVSEKWRGRKVEAVVGPVEAGCM